MSTVHAPVASDRDARPAGRHGAGARARVMALSADHVAVLALATVAVLLAAITWNRWGDPSYDTGLDLVAGAKVSHADLPYLDFDLLVRPARADAARRRLRGRRASRWARPSASASSWPRRASG